MGDLREAHRKYREKAYKSLMKANLIDDPDKRRRLDDALEFKGICEEMCPEWEKIQRIVEKGLWKPEGYDENDERIAIPQKMVKRLARSAAGQEAPLPMDVRSPAACRRTLDYLVDELIASDDRLPIYHHFAWDRSRAIRIDLSVQTPSMSPDDIKHEIYCLETIVRFHATSAHILARPGFSYQDYSEQQEVEQLSKTLISLRERYKACADMGITCDNEAEFRAYYAIFFAWDPSLKDTIESWGEDLAASEAIQTALCVVESMQNTSMLHGPLRPEAPTEIALNAASIFFSIVASPQISYTMACIAEIHFSAVRRMILKTIINSYSRPKGAPKDLTPEFLQRQLRFDTPEDAVAFAELHGLEFVAENGLRYVSIRPHQQLSEPRLPHAYSYGIVERKRNQKPFPDAIHETLYETPQEDVSEHSPIEESLFVEPPKDPAVEPDNTATESELEDSDAVPAPPARGFSIANATTPQVQHGSFGITPAPSIFSGGGAQIGATSSATPSVFGNPPVNNIFGGLPGDKPFGGLAKTSEAEKAATPSDTGKKVTFGETSVKYIESRSEALGSTSSADSSLFSFLSNDQSRPNKTTPEPNSNASSWFPSTLPQASGIASNQEAQSIFAGATPATSVDFKLPSKTTPENSLFGAAGAKSPLSPPAIFGSNPIGTTAGSLFPPIQNPSILSTAPASQSTTAISLFPNASSLSTTTTTPALAPQFGTLTPAPPIISPAQIPAFAASTAAPPSAPPAPKNNPLDGLTRWYVCGDRGLMKDQLEEWAVETILQDIWANYKEMEEERKRKEEDEKSWAEARKFREYSLQVTFFYRWLDIFRKRRVIKRIQMEKEKFRQWNSREAVAKRQEVARAAKEKKQREAVDLIRQSMQDRVKEEDKLRQSTRTREESMEAALLASGIFSGVRDERAAARDAAQDDDEESTDMLPSEMLFRQETRRREKHGLPPLNRLGQPRPYKEGTKTAQLRALMAGRDSMSMSTGSMRNSTFSSSYRSSLGFNGSKVGKMKKSRVSDPYWRMKAHGLVQMPNGDYLHESLARPMLREGRRYAGVGDFGLPPVGSRTSSPLPPLPDELFEERSPLLLENMGSNRPSPTPSVVSNVSVKRKRGRLPDVDVEDEDLAAYRSETSASVYKRPKSIASISNEPDLLSQMQSLLNDVEAEKKRVRGQ